MDAGQHDPVGIGAGRLARQRQTVADDVGDSVENVGRLIIVRQDDRVALALETQERGDIISPDAPFEGGDGPLHPTVAVGPWPRGGWGRGRGLEHSGSLVWLIWA